MSKQADSQEFCGASKKQPGLTKELCMAQEVLIRWKVWAKETPHFQTESVWTSKSIAPNLSLHRPWLEYSETWQSSHSCLVLLTNHSTKPYASFLDYVDHTQGYFVESECLWNYLLPGALRILFGSQQIIISASIAKERYVKVCFLSQDLTVLHPDLFFKRLEARLFNSFTHPLSKYLLSTYCMLGTVLVPEDTATPETDKVNSFMKLTF